MKKIITILNIFIMALCAITLTACGENFDKFSLSFSSTSIELTTNEEKEYEITINNYFNTDVNFDFYLDKKIIDIDENNIVNTGDGVYKIKIKALMTGTTTLTITLLEGNKTCFVPVSVYEPVSNFNLKSNQNLYVIRGQGITFSSDMFSFEPESTLEKELIFSVDSVVLDNNTYNATSQSPSDVTVTAISAHNESLTCEFNLKVLDEIQTNDIELSYNNEIVLPINEDENSFIEIITNSTEQLKKTYTMVYDSNKEYSYSFISKRTNEIFNNSKLELENKYEIDIVQQKENLLEDSLIVRVYYTNFPQYYKDVEYKICFVTVPEKLRINNQIDINQVNLFDNNLQANIQKAKLSVTPKNSTYTKIQAEFYVEDKESGNMTKVMYSQIKEYLCVKYKGIEITDNQIFDDLTAEIEYYGIKVLPSDLYGENIRIRFVCYSDYLQTPIYNEIPVIIRKSATDFYVAEEYTDSTIYVSLNQGEVTFNDFVVKETDAYVGEIVAVADYLSSGYVEITQTGDNLASINIKPLKQGQADYTLILSSGISTRIKIIVREEFNIDNFWLYVSPNNTDYVAEVNYKDLRGNSTLNSVVLRGLGEFEIITNIEPKNINKEMYSLQFVSENPDAIQVDGTKIKAKTIDNKSYNILVTLNIMHVEQFKIVPNPEYQNNIEYSFDVKCFQPISSFSVVGKNAGILNSTYTSKTDVYVGNIGEVDMLMAQVNLKLLIDNEEPDDTDERLKSVDWLFSCTYLETSPNVYELSESGSQIGYFYADTLTFECKSSNSSGYIKITAQIMEYGKVVSASIQINIQTYVQVNSIWLDNYVDQIYLDAVYKEIKLDPYVVPTNATNKNYVVWFEPKNGTSSAIVQIEYDSSYIKLTYAGRGGGQGVLHIVPSSKFNGETAGDVYYESSLNLEVYIGEGTVNNPLHIKTWEEFKNIDLSKHYIIDTIIDAQGEEIYPLGELTGGIKGYLTNVSNQVVNYENVGGIVNFVVKGASTVQNINYYGLFTNIALSGYLMNLTISGSIDVNESTFNTSYIGLVCGVNNGLVKNVNVNLTKGNVYSVGSNNIYVGGVCGENLGSIVADTIKKDAGDSITDIETEKNIDGTLFNNYESTTSGAINANYQTVLPNSTVIVQMFKTFEIYVEKNEQEDLCIGGVSGQNKGLIKFRENKNYIKTNSYGTSCVVDILVTGVTINSNVGGICGTNTDGNIVGLVAKGNISAKSFDNVAGICGTFFSGKIIDNITRVYVKGKNYVAGLVGMVPQTSDSVILQNNKVESVEDGRLGVEASIVSSYMGDAGKESAALYFLGNTKINEDLENNNICQTYMNRNLIEQGGKEYLTNYYGDVIIVSSNNITNVKKFDSALDQISNFEEIINSTLYPQNTIILTYYKSVDESSQYLLNSYNTQRIPNNLFNESFQNLELNITSNATSIISISYDGELILNSTGVATLTLTSAHNYNFKVDIRVVVTNYIDGLKMYATADRQEDAITSINVLNVTNRNILNLYPKYGSQIVTNNGFIVDLVENNQAKLDVETNDEYILVTQSGGIVMLQGNGADDSLENIRIDFYVYLPVTVGAKTNNYYLHNDGTFGVVKEEANLSLSANYKQGIYDIELDKTNMEIVPSDIINLRVKYLTDDESDKLTLTLRYLEDGSYVEYDEDNLEGFNKYFTVQISDKILDKDGKYCVDYVFALNTESEVKLGQYQFVFSSSLANVYKILNVKYYSQPIDSVIIKNYTFKDNENIEIGEDDGNIIYNTSYTMQESNTVTAGKTNILRILINPHYSNYSYVEVSNDATNISEGKAVLFGLLKQYGENQNQAVVSTNGYATANGIRVYKKDIQAGDLKILYRLHTNVVEGESIVLNINFYDENGSLVFTQQQKVLTIAIDKTLNVSIAGKENAEKIYLAKGMTYALNVNSVGYASEDIYITSLSPYIEIIEDNNSYYLKVADNINYVSGKEGVDVTISYYGKRLVNGIMVESSKKTLNCTIVEYVFDNLNVQSMFAQEKILLGVGTAVDIRDKIIENLNIEYSNNAIDSVNLLKNSLKQSASYYYLQNDAYVNITTDTNIEMQNDYKLIGFNYTPLRVGQNIFNVGVYCELYYMQGYLVVRQIENPSEISFDKIQQFSITAVQRSLQDAPLPIYNYEDLLNMIDDNYYRLMADIELPFAFEPLNVNIKSLDGNGKKIIINSGIYKDNDAYLNKEKYGLFETISEETIISNLTIEIKDNGTTMFVFDNSTSVNAFNFGLLAAENNGVITNCEILMANTSAALVVTNNSSNTNTNRSYISGLVAVNNGYVTNSRVYLKIEANGANLSGLVAVNNGHISSCYVKNSMIKNSSTNANNSTGGIVVLNNGTILSTYIEGSYNEGLIKIFAENEVNIVSASSMAGAFVYQNSGKIKDCYANIPVVASSRNSGFVCINNGEIYTSYTTSKLGDGDYENYPFIITQGEDSIIQSCYYLSDSLFNVNVNQSNNNISGLRPTSLAEFVIGYEIQEINGNDTVTQNKLFEEFIQNKNGDYTSGVWFFAKEENAHEFKPGNTITSIDIQKYILYSSFVTYLDFSCNGVQTQFVANRLQLVSANMIAYSEKELNSTYDAETGIYTYDYFTNNIYAEDGSKYNPIIIYSAVQFENHVINNSLRNVNSLYYRFVKDIDYTNEGLVVSSLYKITFAGYIEGNGMTITGFSINTNESMISAGYFAQIGDGNQYAVVQNLNFAPKYINLPNAYNVGTIAGTVTRAYVYNLNVDAYVQNRQGLVILGRNIVGGVFGRTISSFDINCIGSSVSANAYYTNQSTDFSSDEVQQLILYEEFGSNNDTVSYAGSIIGYVAGTGTIKNPKITNDVASIGMICGFMFGGIGINATVEEIEMTTSYGQQNFIRASAYGGLIVGDLKGKIVNATVQKSSSTEKLYDLFRLEPRVPLAVGGVSGIVRGGTVENVSIYEDLTFENAKSSIPKTVGGFAGKVLQKAIINNFNYYGNKITGRNIVGGVIGELQIDVNKTVNVEISNVQIGTDEQKTIINLQKPAGDQEAELMYIAGLIGLINNVTLDSNNNQNINIEIEKIKINCQLIADIKVYGSILTDDNQTQALYYLYVGFVFGGYYSNSINFANLGIDLTLNEDEDNEDEDIDIETYLNVQNIRNGNNSNGVPKEFQISFGYVIGIESSNTLPISPTNVAITLNDVKCTISTSETNAYAIYKIFSEH